MHLNNMHALIWLNSRHLGSTANRLLYPLIQTCALDSQGLAKLNILVMKHAFEKGVAREVRLTVWTNWNTL